MLQRDKFCVLSGLVGAKEVHRVLHGGVSWKKKLSARRTASQRWKGAMNLTTEDLRFFALVKLPDGRVDVSLPEALWTQLVNRSTCTRVLGLFPRGFRIAHLNLLIGPPSDQ